MGRGFGPKGGAERGLRQVPTPRASSSLTNAGVIGRSFAVSAAHVGDRTTIDAPSAREADRSAHHRTAHSLRIKLVALLAVWREGTSRRHPERREWPRQHGTGHCSSRLRRRQPPLFRGHNSYSVAGGVAAAAQALTSCRRGPAARWSAGGRRLLERFQLPPRLLPGTIDEDCALTANEGGMP